MSNLVDKNLFRVDAIELNTVIDYFFKLFYAFSNLCYRFVGINDGLSEGDPGTPVVEGFESLPVGKPVNPGMIDEASGIADSKMNPGFLWVQQDSGNPNDIALLSHDGGFLKVIILKQRLIAIGKIWHWPMVLFTVLIIFILLILVIIILHFLLFYLSFCGTLSGCNCVANVDKIIYQYPDGTHDAEAILVDNKTKDIYIITKKDAPSRIYKLAFPQSTSAVNTASFSGSLSFSGVTCAAFSPDGKEMVVKTYTAVW